MVVYGTRTVQLPRRRDDSLGFSVRGGREHGTGLFVSHVVPGSDAQRHGLKVGDEVLQVNGLSVKKSTHKEVVSVIKNSNFVQLRVRGALFVDSPRRRRCWTLPRRLCRRGKRPEHAIDMLRTWYPGASVAWRTVETIETRIYIGLTGQTTLGCSICKGPPGWPGVFVQSTKEVGLAREVGLRPGDQILQCNGVSFVDIDFAKVSTSK
ncbi:Harmonin [Amphibalanus amphitrite]|uniref:Harmonin n=1 Tax=Amphibalanus amphitrite TaxID=1232801 RepID=A0A6A4VQJ1_AMPAM|nr:Harmonin [Amphibalanus amphitrite]